MQHFTIGDGKVDTGCHVCCCQPATTKPGTKDKWVLNYAPVVVPNGGIAITERFQHNVEVVTCDSCGADGQPSPVAHPVLTTTPVDTALNGDLTTSVDNPDNKPLAFKAVPFEGPKHGQLTINANGTYTYTPYAGFEGYDSFFWQVTIDGGQPVVQEAIIGVGAVTAPTASMVRPALSITNVNVDNRNYWVTFGLCASPALKPGDVYRITFKMQYRDCDGCYDRSDCFDVTVGKC